MLVSLRSCSLVPRQPIKKHKESEVAHPAVGRTLLLLAPTTTEAHIWTRCSYIKRKVHMAQSLSDTTPPMQRLSRRGWWLWTEHEDCPQTETPTTCWTCNSWKPHVKPNRGLFLVRWHHGCKNHHNETLFLLETGKNGHVSTGQGWTVSFHPAIKFTDFLKISKRV